MDQERFNRAIGLRDSGKVEEALRELIALAGDTADPDEKASIVLNESACLATLGRFGEARERIRAAKRLSPREEIHARADYGEALLCGHEGKQNEGLRRIERLLTEHREVLSSSEHRDLYENAQVQRGIFLTNLSRFKEATPVLEEALSFQLERSDRAEVHYCLGLCHSQLGGVERAKAELLAAIEEPSDSRRLVLAHYHLGVVHFRKGAYARALQEFGWCAPRAKEADIPNENIYGWLEKTARALGLDDEADRYRRLAKT